MISVYYERKLTVAVTRSIVEGKIALEVVANYRLNVRGLLLTLVVTVELLLYTVAIVSLAGPSNDPELTLRSYTAVYLVRKAHVMLVV